MSQRDDERSGGEQPAEAADPVAEAAALLGPDLARYLQTDPNRAHTDTGQFDDPDASLDEPTAAFDLPAGLLDRATLPQPSGPPVPLPVVDELEDDADDSTTAEPMLTAPAPVAIPVSPLAAGPIPPPLGVPTPPPVPPRKGTDPLPRPVPVATPRPSPARATPVAVARPVVVGPSEQSRQRRRPTHPLTSGIRPTPETDPPDEAEPSVILDFGGESEAVTMVFTGEAAPELPRGRLVVANGPNQGKVWYLNRPQTSIGRAQDNDIVLLDSSVSRHHLRVERHPDGFRLLDAGSVNGAWVNGVKTGDHELYDGDRVLLGEITLTFSTVGRARVRPSLGDRVTDPGRAVARPGLRRRRVPMSWLLAWLATTLVAVVVTVSVTRVVRHRRAQQVRQQAEAHRLEAKAAVEQRAWPRARAALVAARALSPALLDYQAELARLDQAERHEQIVEAARHALAAGDPRTALERLALVGPNSPYAVDARTLRQQAQALANLPARPR